MIKICKLEDIPKLGARRYVQPDGETIAIFRTAADTVFALADKCPHKGGPLSQGIVFGESVACPLHNWCIDLKSGCAAAPDEGSVKRFLVRVVNGQVELLDGHTREEDRHPRVGGDPIDWAPADAGATKAA